MNRFPIVILAFFLFAAVPASANQDDPRLDELFGRLKATGDPVEAATLQEIIWRLWLETDNQKVARLFEQGREVMLREDYVTALHIASRIVEIDPAQAEGWNLRATVFYVLGDYESSIQDVEKTLALEPRHFGALVGLGMMLVEMNRDQDALKAFERALALNPHLEQARQQIEAIKLRVQGDDV
ncbi:MAG: tetratricopeptide repeat protein [Pseudomonadota bacterium]